MHLLGSDKCISFAYQFILTEELRRPIKRIEQISVRLNIPKGTIEKYLRKMNQIGLLVKYGRCREINLVLVSDRSADNDRAYIMADKKRELAYQKTMTEWNVAVKMDALPVTG